MKKTLLTLIALASLTFAQGKMAAGVQGVFALPMGSFGDAFNSGFGGQGVFSYGLTKDITLTGKVGYLTWGNKITSDASFTTIPVLVGARYGFSQGGGFTPYGTVEAGMHFASVKVVTPEVKIGNVVVVPGGTSTSSSSDFGIGFGAGALYPIGNNLHLDFGAQYNIIMTSGSSTNYLSVVAGVLFGL